MSEMPHSQYESQVQPCVAKVASISPDDSKYNVAQCKYSVSNYLDDPPYTTLSNNFHNETNYIYFTPLLET